MICWSTLDWGLFWQGVPVTQVNTSSLCQTNEALPEPFEIHWGQISSFQFISILYTKSKQYLSTNPFLSNRNWYPIISSTNNISSILTFFYKYFKYSIFTKKKKFLNLQNTKRKLKFKINDIRRESCSLVNFFSPTLYNIE